MSRPSAPSAPAPLTSRRRIFLLSSGIVGAGALAALGLRAPRALAAGKEAPVTANEDLMREHGILRRALVVYRECAARLRAGRGDVPPGAIGRAAELFRTFGEDYHESKVEEPHVFPAVKRAGGAAAGLVDVLVDQHRRGREVTRYVESMAAAGRRFGARAAEVAGVLESFARMYEAHAAREDTIVFPAWKKTMSARDYDATGERFEAIERAQFGHDGFEDAEKRMGEIEGQLGLADLASFTAPAPPHAD